MQNPDHFRDVSRLAAEYITPGGAEDVDDNAVMHGADDQKYPSTERQMTEYFNNKYAQNQLKDLVETVFEEHFDKEGNGNIDITEFTQSLQNLGLINMTKIRMLKLFEFISIADGSLPSSHAYIDKEDLSEFLLQNYDDNPKLQHYKEELLTALSPKFKDAQPATMGILPSLTTSQSEEAAMKQQLGWMVEKELKQMEAESHFQEELLKRKTRAERNGKKYCDEPNAKEWDAYEVAYWVGAILGFTYCMKRFLDHNMNGNRLLFDVIKMDANVLQKHLSLKAIHLNSFQRRLENLRRTALKEKAKSVARGKGRTLSLDFNSSYSVHIASETSYKAEEKRNREQRIQLEAIQNESVLNKQITSLTKDKLELVQQIHDIKERYENEIAAWKQKMEPPPAPIMIRRSRPKTPQLPSVFIRSRAAPIPRQSRPVPPHISKSLTPELHTKMHRAIPHPPMKAKRVVNTFKRKKHVKYINRRRIDAVNEIDAGTFGALLSIQGIETYDVVFTGIRTTRKCGIELVAFDEDNNIGAVVTKCHTPYSKQHVVKQSLLMSMNDKVCFDMDYDEILSAISTSARPLTLRFHSQFPKPDEDEAMVSNDEEDDLRDIHQIPDPKRLFVNEKEQNSEDIQRCYTMLYHKYVELRTQQLQYQLKQQRALIREYKMAEQNQLSLSR